jgi:uncharacterized protein
MARAITEIAFTDAVRAEQVRNGSREAYRRFDDDPNRRDTLSAQERGFIAERDSFYMATVGENGWPYVQHRGGPKGFLKVLDEGSIGFADYRGNRQYISVGNLNTDARVSLILMDYPNRRRLKLWATARTVQAGDDPALLAMLAVPGYRATIERGIVMTLAAIDWNCPQHITPRYTEAELLAMIEQRNNRADEA